uniref:Uncharacterized protein n=1 Tax=Anopheles maculatus TaxID=74869 RepID=A0A182SS92_9DIPT
MKPRTVLSFCLSVKVEYRKSYGTSASSQPFLPAASQATSSSEQPGPQRSIIYCVHGQLADSCCELPNELNIRKIDCKKWTVVNLPPGSCLLCIRLVHHNTAQDPELPEWPINGQNWFYLESSTTNSRKAKLESG